MIDDIGTSSHYDQVREFHEKAEQPIRTVPQLPPAGERFLRAKLILEECLETIEALGFDLWVGYGENVWQPKVGENTTMLVPNAKESLVEIADGCADIAVVTSGTLIACGIKDIPLQEEVNLNNLAKFTDGGYRRDDGKWIKPPNHQPPDIEALLREQGWDGQR